MEKHTQATFVSLVNVVQKDINPIQINYGPDATDVRVPVHTKTTGGFHGVKTEPKYLGSSLSLVLLVLPTVLLDSQAKGHLGTYCKLTFVDHLQARNQQKRFILTTRLNRINLPLTSLANVAFFHRFPITHNVFSYMGECQET
jgi:hypothetical protein